MRYVLMVFLFCLSALAGAQNTQSPDQIRSQMAEIRRTTNWDDPVAAEKANAEIKILAKQLMTSGNTQSGSGTDSGTGNQQGQGQTTDAGKLNEATEEMVDYSMEMMSQIIKSAAGGEGADILLAEPVRKEIIKEFKEDEKRSLDPEIMEKMDILILDMSMPGIDAIIDAMPLFRSISTLVIYSGKNGATVDLPMIFKNAENYPLKELYILNFGRLVTSLPNSISQFKDIKILNLSGNNLQYLPTEIEGLNQITELYLNNNPLETLFPQISELKNLITLCLLGTTVPENEVARIEELYPQCKIFRQ
jgi:CheY-like chemotaxis protein